jgi:hypothetical protein
MPLGKRREEKQEAIWIEAASLFSMLMKPDRLSLAHTASRLMCALCACQIMYASSAVAIRTPTEVIIASDSYVTRRTGNSPARITVECKIHSVNGVFFSIVGILFEGDFVAQEVAARHLTVSRTLPEAIKAFDSEMESRLPAVMASLRRKGSPDYTNRIGKSVTEVIFATMSGSTPVMYVRYYMSSLLPNGDIRVEAKGLACPGTDCAEGVKFAATGEHTAIDASMGTNKGPWNPATLAARLRSYVQMEIDELPTQVGAPITVLQLDPSGTHWIQPGNCTPGAVKYQK